MEVYTAEELREQLRELDETIREARGKPQSYELESAQSRQRVNHRLLKELATERLALVARIIALEQGTSRHFDV
jgi:hypothetical protein